MFISLRAVRLKLPTIVVLGVVGGAVSYSAVDMRCVVVVGVVVVVVVVVGTGVYGYPPYVGISHPAVGFCLAGFLGSVTSYGEYVG